MRSSSLVLTDEQRRQLEDLVRRPTTPQRSVWRALIVLAAADRQGYRSICPGPRSDPEYGAQVVPTLCRAWPR